MNITDMCRKNLHNRLGIHKPSKPANDMLAEIAGMTAKLQEIVELAKPRLIMGGIRYGSDWTHEPLMEYMQSKLTAYRETGNFEMFVDLFNFVAVEGQLKTHPNYHFNSLDRL